MRWHTKPITQLVVMFVVMLVVIGAQSAASAFLTGNTQNKTVAKVENTGLRKVVGGSGCDAGSPDIILGDTERDPTNSDPRVPIRTNRHDYEFSGAYFTRAILAEANASNINGTFKIKSNYADYLTYPDDNDPVDRTGGTRGSGVTGILGKMFRYKPDRLADAYFVKYVSSTVQGPDTLVKGTNPIIEVPTAVDGTIYAPDTGYEIAPGYGAMVAYADANRITMHIGRHEYFAGTGQPNCHGQACSGGYWITISNVCVDSKIIVKYGEVSGRQNQVGSNIVTDTLQLPMLANGAPIAKTNGSPAVVVLRDNGPIISAYKPFYWEGATVRPFTPTNTPVAGTPTNTPPVGTSTPTPIPNTPTVTPTTAPDPNLPCGYGSWRYTCGQEGTDINEAQCESNSYEGKGLNYCSSGYSCTPLEVHYSITQVANYAGEYCTANTPTPTATATPTPSLPGVTSYPTQLYLTFAGSCYTNQLCNKLLQMHGSDHNGEKGILNYGSGTSEFNLGNGIQYTVGSGIAQYRLFMLTSIPDYNSWGSGTYLKLPSNDSTQYVIKP